VAAAVLPPQLATALTALEVSCPRSVRPAVDTLRRLLTGARRPLPAASTLTAARLPVELTVGAGVDEVRYTVDPAALGGPPDAQWRLVADVLPASAQARRHLGRLTGASVPWAGSWLGVRHGGPDVAVKLYQRLDAGQGAHALARLARAALAASGPPIAPVLAGADANGALEVYGRVRGYGRRAVHAALAWGGAGAALPAVETSIALLRERLVSSALDDVAVGMSWRVDAGGAAVGTVFLHGVEVFPDDVVARRRLLALGDRLRIDTSGYRAVTAALGATPPPLVHGIVGLTAHPYGGVAPSVTLAADARLLGAPLVVPAGA
jgi:hypothetical protein